MKYYIGIDLGTSSVKVILLNSDGQVVSSVTKDYPLYFPKDGWSEQNPEDWYNEAISALNELLEGKRKENVVSISFSGQMHGLVMLDENCDVIRPAILWCDQRTASECEEIEEKIIKLIRKSNARGGTDNISIAYLVMESGEE